MADCSAVLSSEFTLVFLPRTGAAVRADLWSVGGTGYPNLPKLMVLDFRPIVRPGALLQGSAWRRDPSAKEYAFSFCWLRMQVQDSYRGERRAVPLTGVFGMVVAVRAGGPPEPKQALQSTVVELQQEKNGRRANARKGV